MWQERLPRSLTMSAPTAVRPSPAISVISGGSAGMGLAAAQRLGADGGRVAILGRRPDALDKALQTIREAGASDAIAIRTDATVDEEVAAAFTTIDDRWGEINALVNAVGPA